MKKILFIGLLLITSVCFAQIDNNCVQILSSSGENECLLTTYQRQQATMLSDAPQDPSTVIICQGSTLTYNAIMHIDESDLVSYQWTVTGATSYTTSNDGSSIQITWGSSGHIGVIELTATTSQGTECHTTKYFYLVETPIIQSSSSYPYFIENGNKVIQVCKGSSVSFMDESQYFSETNVNGYYWESNIYGTASTKNYTLDNVTEDNIVTHIVRSYCGCDAKEVYEIRVVEKEKLELSCYGTACEGSIVKYTALNANNCSEYNWYVQGGQIISGHNSPTIEVLWGSPEEGYGIIGLDGSFCENLCDIYMPVKIPIISGQVKIAGQDQVCLGDNIVYSLPLWGSTDYIWTITPNTASVYSGENLNEKVINFGQPGTYTISCSYKCQFLNCGFISSQPKTVVVRPKLSINGNREICLYSTGNFSTNSTDPVNWILYKNGQPIINITATTLSYDFNTMDSYYLTAENSSYCNIANIYIKMKQKPTLSLSEITGETNICPNSSVLLKYTGSSYNNYIKWEHNILHATPSSIIGDEVTISFENNFGEISVFKVDEETRCVSDPVLYVINELIPATIDLPSNIDNQCAGSIIHFDIPEQEGVFYEWTISPAECATVTGDKTLGEVDILVNRKTNYVPFTINFNRTYCNNTQLTQVQVTVNQGEPTISFDNQVCSNHDITFTANGCDDNDNNYIWEIDGGSHQGKMVTHAFSTGGTYNVKMTYRPSTDYAPITKEGTITVSNSPTLNISRSSNTLTASVNYDSDNSPAHSYSYSWEFGPGETHISSSASCNLNNGYGNYKCTVTNINTNCAAEDTYIYDNYPVINIPISTTSSCATITATANIPTPLNLTWSTSPGSDIVLSNNTQTATIVYNKAGQHTIKATAISGGNKYEGQKTVIVPFVPKFKLMYDCATNNIIITSQSEFYNINQQTLTFSISNGNRPYLLTLSPNQPYLAINVPAVQTQTTYTITLNYGDCSLAKEITIYPPTNILAISSPNNTNLCQDVKFPFIADVSGEADNYSWDFGDGSNFGGNGIIHTFGLESGLESVRKLVTLTVIDKNGCSHVSSKLFTIKSDDIKNTSLMFDNDIEVCPGTARMIKYPYPNNIFSYQWSPNKLAINTTANINEYNTFYTGDYEVKLISNIGCIGNKKINVEFLNKPEIIFDVFNYKNCGNHVRFRCLNSNYYFNWIIVDPNGNTEFIANNTTQNSISFDAQMTGFYSLFVEVTNSDGCSNSITLPFVVYAAPDKPVISFGGNPCIHQPAVILQEQLGRNINWNIGEIGVTASYFTPGYASAFYIDPQTGCKSDTTRFFINPAPNFDALLTGCYKKCVPTTMPVYQLSPIQTDWKWYFNNNGIFDGNTRSFTLPIPDFGEYFMEAWYGNGCFVTSPKLNIEPKEPCDCEGIEINNLEKYNCRVEECRLIYYVDIEVCNYSGYQITFDQINAMTGVNMISNPIPFTLQDGECKIISLEFELTDPSVPFAQFGLYSSERDCLRDFAISLDLSECVSTKECEIEIESLEFLPELSTKNNNVAFQFILSLPYVPQIINNVWASHDGIQYYNYSGGTTIDGVAFFNYGDISQLANEGKDVCFSIIMCVDNKICKATVCIAAKKLIEMSDGNYVKSKYNENNINIAHEQLKPYLVPNPASTNVTIKGIDEDIVSLILIDMNGKTLKEINFTNTINVTDIDKGIYILRVKSISNSIYYLKLIRN